MVDECDVVLSDKKGMILEMEYICKLLSERTQYIMTSATMPSEIKMRIKCMSPRPFAEVSLEEGNLELS